MKIAGLICGIGLTLLSGITLVVCLMLPSMTHNRVNMKEAMVGILPALFFGVIGLIITAVSAFILLKSKKQSGGQGKD
jgi:Co/Zn/Cd efflux system component